jgi:hypothetical protein
MHIAIWILALIALALWSAAAWGVGTLLGLDPSWVGDLKPLVQQIPYAALIDQWLPGWQDMLLTLLDLTRSLLAWAGGAGVVVVWVLWALGAALIVGAAAALSLVVALVRRTSAKGPPPSAAAA